MRALVVVDYQNDFVSGPLGGADAAAIEGAVCARMEEYLGSGDPVFVTMDTHGPDYLSTREGAMLPVPHCVRGTHGWMLAGRVEALARMDGCRIIEKGTFGCAELLEILRPFDEIELCGVATNVCVLANAVIARTANPQARVVVRRSCVASYDPALGGEALDVMGSLQVEVLRRRSGRLSLILSALRTASMYLSCSASAALRQSWHCSWQVCASALSLSASS